MLNISLMTFFCDLTVIEQYPYIIKLKIEEFKCQGLLCKINLNLILGIHGGNSEK